MPPTDTSGSAPSAANSAAAAGSAQKVDHLEIKILSGDVISLQAFIEEVDEKEGTSEHETKAMGDKIRKATARLTQGRCWKLKSEACRKRDLDEVEKRIILEVGSGAGLPISYEDIKKLVILEKHPIYAKALGEWSRKESLFIDRMERKKSMKLSMKNEVFQLVGWFIATQSFLFTAVAGSNLLHCNNMWYPMCLSMLASFVTFFGIILKMLQIEDIRTTTHTHVVQPLENIQRSLNALRKAGIKEFKFGSLEYSDNNANRASKAEWILYVAVMLCLLAFAVGFPLAFQRILCRPGSNP